MRIKTLLAVSLGVSAVGAAAAYAQYRNIEKPQYELLVSEEQGFELREYGPMIVAEVTHTGERSRALNAGFRRLAAYILAEDRPGANDDKIAMTSPVVQDRQSAKIAMTSPVMQDSGSTDSWRTRFVMPSEYTLDTLPEAPEDITLTTVPARRMAAVVFNGWGSEQDLAMMESALREWMEERGLTPAGDAEYAFYDAPMVPGPMRRNEVMIPVAKGLNEGSSLRLSGRG